MKQIKMIILAGTILMINQYGYGSETSQKVLEDSATQEQQPLHTATQDLSDDSGIWGRGSDYASISLPNEERAGYTRSITIPGGIEVADVDLSSLDNQNQDPLAASAVFNYSGIFSQQNELQPMHNPTNPLATALDAGIEPEQRIEHTSQSSTKSATSKSNQSQSTSSSSVLSTTPMLENSSAPESQETSESDQLQFSNSSSLLSTQNYPPVNPNASQDGDDKGPDGNKPQGYFNNRGVWVSLGALAGTAALAYYYPEHVENIGKFAQSVSGYIAGSSTDKPIGTTGVKLATSQSGEYQ